MIGKLFGIMSRPTKTWQDIAEMSEGKFRLYLAYPVILALIPAFAWFYGTTQIGWSLGDREAIKFSAESARKTIVDRTADTLDKKGVFTGRYVVNPYNGEKIPLWVSDYVLMEYGTGKNVPKLYEIDDEYVVYMQKFIEMEKAGEAIIGRLG